VLNEIGGFKTHFRSGADTQLCLKIIKSGKKILYAPDVIVYHHRRPLFISHLRQVKTYGLHRGYFAKKLSENSAKRFYFLPSLFFACLAVGLVLSLVKGSFVYPFALSSVCYLLACLASGLWSEKSLKVALLTFIGIPLTHLAYGAGFAQGLMTRKLGEKPSY
jgi:hypothetical protein